MDPKTTLRENDSAKVHADVAALHFSGPETGASLRCWPAGLVTGRDGKR